MYIKAAWEYEQEELRSGGDPPPCPRCGRRGFYAPRFAEPDRRYRACKFCGLWQNVGKPPHEIIRYECHQHPDGSEVADWKEPHESWDCPSCGRHFTPEESVPWPSERPDHNWREWPLRGSQEEYSRFLKERDLPHKEFGIV